MNTQSAIDISIGLLGRGRQDRRLAWGLAGLAPVMCLPLVWGVNAMSRGQTTFSTLVLVLLLGVSVVTDVSRRKIYNAVTYTAALWAVAISTLGQFVPESWVNSGVVPLGAIGLTDCLFGFGVCFFVMLFAYQLAGGGAGDVKLAAAIGALVGVQMGLLSFAMTYVVAGIAVLVWLAWINGPVFVLTMFMKQLGRMVLPGLVPTLSTKERSMLIQPIPMAPFFAIGTALALIIGPMWR